MRDEPPTPTDRQRAGDHSHEIKVSVPRSLLDRLDAIAAARNRTRDSILREALAAWAARAGGSEADRSNEQRASAIGNKQ